MRNLITILLLCLLKVAMAQGWTNPMSVEMNLGEAYDFNDQYGVSFRSGVSLAGGKEIIVKVYSKARYDNVPSGNSVEDALMYAVHVTQNTLNAPSGTSNNPYVMDSFNFSARTYAPFNPKLFDLQNNYDPFNNSLFPLPNPTLSRQGTEFKTYLMKEIAYNQLFQDVGTLHNKTLDVLVDIEFIGGLTFTDIEVISLPGLKLSDADLLSMQVFVNGVSINVTGQGIPQINTKVGDKIEFFLEGVSLASLSNEGKTPSALNLPKAWIARFAGDVTYFLDASHKPGNLKPWIGFDSQQHWLNVRNYEQDKDYNDHKNYPGWEDATKSGQSGISLTYYVEAPMDESPSLNSQYYDWNKFTYNKSPGNPNYKGSDHGDATVQRANQKEGNNMLFLHFWNNDNSPWQEQTTYRNYNSQNLIKYWMGFDDDEILYMNAPYPEESNNTNGIYALPLGDLRWQVVPTNEDPSINESISDQIRAYYTFHNQGGDFVGYEIQQEGTDQVNPDGLPGSSVIAADGRVSLCLEQDCHDEKRIDINATSAFKGFYLFQGPSHPGRNVVTDYSIAYNEAGTGNTLGSILLEYISMGYEITIEYETQDSNGNLKNYCQSSSGWTSASNERMGLCTHQVYSTNLSLNRNQSGSNPLSGFTTATTSMDFKMKTYADSYCSITMYLVKDSEDLKIPIAGKGIYPMSLAFMEDQNLVSGPGEGGYFFTEEQRQVEVDNTVDQIHGPFDVPRGAKFVNPFVREYTFYVGDQSVWKAWDSDPYFLGGPQANPEQDWYLSNKALASRVWDEEIASGQMIKYYFEELNGTSAPNGHISDTDMRMKSPVSTERTFTKTYLTPGTYQLTAMYMDGPGISHKIVVKPARSSNTSPIADITVEDLPDYDRNLLNTVLTGGNQLDPTKTYKVLSVENISSEFVFKQGQRCNYSYAVTQGTTQLNPSIVDPNKFKGVNRWGPYLDFEGKFYWSKSISGPVKYEEIPEGVSISLNEQTHSWMFSVAGQLANQNVSEAFYNTPNQMSFPDLWGNHFSSLWKKAGPNGNPGPDYIDVSTIPADLKDFSSTETTTLDGYFATIPDPHYWQYLATLNSYSDAYGNRMRYNPSHIYDMERLFDDTYGAFTGNAVTNQFPSGRTYTSQAYPSDNFQNLKAWYHDLRMGRKLILEESDYNLMKNDINLLVDFDVEEGLYAGGFSGAESFANGQGLKLELIDPVGASDRVAILVCDDCDLEDNSGARIASEEEVLATDDDATLNEDIRFQLYPNPVSRNMQLNIPLETDGQFVLGIYNLSGMLIRREAHRGVEGSNQVELADLDRQLTSGLYILKCEIHGHIYERKFLFELGSD